jgi:TolA-binding protein
VKKLVALAALMNCGLAFAVAEPPGSDAMPPNGSSAAANEEEQQVVLVEAWRRNVAMDAFMRGDFATAEVEFKKNIRCIRRDELQLQYSFTQGLLEMSRAAPGYGNAPHVRSLPLRPDELAERTCHSKEWQYYMIGLSQVQLGRFADAKKSFATVASMGKEDALFDAHYRLGLLELLDGDVNGADRQLTKLTKLNASCARRVRCEVGADLAEATAYLGRAVNNARQGGH